jgi:hypothetical protein
LESDFDHKTSEKKLESSPDAEYASVAEWVWLESKFLVISGICCWTVFPAHMRTMLSPVAESLHQVTTHFINFRSLVQI